jgi:hypothetical protein
MFLINNLKRKRRKSFELEILSQDLFSDNQEKNNELYLEYTKIIQELEKTLYSLILGEDLESNIKLLNILDNTSFVLKFDQNKKDCFVVKCDYIHEDGTPKKYVLDKMPTFIAIDLLSEHDSSIILNNHNQIYMQNGAIYE